MHEKGVAYSWRKVFFLTFIVLYFPFFFQNYSPAATNKLIKEEIS